MSHEVMFKAELSPFVDSDPMRNGLYITPEGGGRPFRGIVPVYQYETVGWQQEELTWHDSCYLHAGLNPFIWYHVKGEDFINLLNAVSISTFNNFPVGKARHCILCNDKGKIIIDGIVVRRADDEFITMCLPDWNDLNISMGNCFDIKCENKSDDYFFYQLCGPKSLEIVEHASKQDIHDLKFMHTKDVEIAGKKVFLLRTCMAGTIGYEVHGNFEDCIDVYRELKRVGESYGMLEIGRHAYRNTHTEGDIPQAGLHFSFGVANLASEITGSFGSESKFKYWSPIDCGWEKMINFNHDFPGKSALKVEIEGHHNTLVHLIWNIADCVKVMEASLDPEKKVDIMDVCEDFNGIYSSQMVHMDAVMDGERVIGAASGRMFSPKKYEMHSLCCIDQDYAVEGKEVEILWGRPGTYQMRIRAMVTLEKYVTVMRNDSFDVENIPHPQF